MVRSRTSFLGCTSLIVSHSLPNASQSMDFSTLRMEIFAVESIAPGKEISIEYLPGLLLLTRAERSATLRSSFGFPRCLCSACTASEELGAKSDERRMRLKAIVESLKGEADRPTKLGWLVEMRGLLAEEKYIGPPDFGECCSIHLGDHQLRSLITSR